MVSFTCWSGLFQCDRFKLWLEVVCDSGIASTEVCDLIQLIPVGVFTRPDWYRSHSVGLVGVASFLSPNKECDCINLLRFCSGTFDDRTTCVQVGERAGRMSVPGKGSGLCSCKITYGVDVMGVVRVVWTVAFVRPPCTRSVIQSIYCAFGSTLAMTEEGILVDENVQWMMKTMQITVAL